MLPSPPLRSKTRTILRKAGHKPYLGTLGIMDEGKPGMIPSVNVKTSVPTLSALQLVKGVKKDEETFVAHHLLNPLFSGDRGSSLDSEARVDGPA